MAGASFMALLAVRPPLAVSYTDTAFNNSASTTYTFTSRSIGSAADNRWVVVGVQTIGINQNVSSVSVGGVAATMLARTTGNTGCTEFWIAKVPTGTAATISVVWPASANRTSVALWALYGGNGTISDQAASTANPASASLTIPQDGVGLGLVNGVNSTFTWSGGGMSERYDYTYTGGSTSVTGADSTTAGTSTITVTRTGSNPPTNNSLFVSFAP